MFPAKLYSWVQSSGVETSQTLQVEESKQNCMFMLHESDNFSNSFIDMYRWNVKPLNVNM
jgi:hypothetical protein